MQQKWLILVLLGVIGGTGLLAACHSGPPPANANSPATLEGKVLTPAADGVARISVADAIKAVDKGEAVIVDTRDAHVYKDEHIKGSINVPIGEWEAKVDQLPKDKLLIAYCS